jgi:hypothetical protein
VSRFEAIRKRDQHEGRYSQAAQRISIGKNGTAADGGDVSFATHSHFRAAERWHFSSR